MEYTMKIKYTIPVMVSTAVLLAACGGGGSSVTTSSMPNTLSKPSYKLTGTVPGTLIEAFCEDGSHYSVNSESNGTNQHPFTLELPNDLSCRLVMTTNENDPNNKVVTPIRFVNSAGASSIAFSSNQDIDLAFVDLPLTREEMHSDQNNDGVEDTPKDISLDSAVSEALNIIIVGVDALDDDKDGIINVFEDDDGDHISNMDDDDDDGDGILDIEDNDHNNDGVDDNDTDNDGITNDNDVDDDNDGIKDEEDSDDDNDGIVDEEDADHEVNNPAVTEDSTESENSTDDDSTNYEDARDHDDDDDDDHEGDSQNNDDENDHEEDGNGGQTPSGPVVTTPSAGRLLASQCSQCHGTDSNPFKGFDNLLGENISGELLEMQRKNKNELMHLQAKGYSREQISLMADYFRNLSGNRGGNK